MKTKYMSRFFITLFLILMVFGSTANATTVDYSFILTTQGDNPYGATTGDIVTVSISYDDTKGISDSGLTTYAYGWDPTFTLDFILGTEPFDETDQDMATYPGFPAVTIYDADGSINNISFDAEDDINVNGVTYTSYISIGIDQPNDPILLTAISTEQGYEWSITGTAVAGNPVPEPATITLLGLSLLGLAGLNRKRSLQ